MLLVSEARLRQMHTEKIQTVEIHKRSDKEWLIYVVKEEDGQELRFGMNTFRQKERVFSSPATAIKHIEKNLPGVAEITLVLHHITKTIAA